MENRNENENNVIQFFKNPAVLVTTVILLLTVAIIASAAIATNRAKKKFGFGLGVETESITVSSEDTQTEQTASANPGGVSVETGAAETQKSDNNSTDAGASVTDDGFSLPVSGTVAKNHSSSIQVYSATMDDYRVHLGIDITSDENAPVCAAADGKVEKIWSDPLMGVCVALTHEGNICSVYKNLNATLASGITVGAEVREGQAIGTVGNSAISELADEPHLHFEMTVNGLSVDPLDYLSAAAVKTLADNAAYEDGTVETETSATETARAK